MTIYKILLGLFKRVICLPIAAVMWFLGHPGTIFIMIPHGIYWILTGRDLMDDSEDFIHWCIN